MIKELKNYSNLYVDKCGNFWSKKLKGTKLLSDKLRPLKGFKTKKGYITIRVSAKKGVRAHRLVAETFISNPNNYPYVCHKNNIKTDNRVENLFWGTCRMNLQQAGEDGFMSRLGENNYSAKLNNQQVKLIRMMFEIFKWKRSKILNILGKAWGVSKASVNSIIAYFRKC
jgi:hypothetical protein